MVGLDQLGNALGRRRALGLAAPVGPLVAELVEAGGQALGQAPGVDEDQRRAVRLDQLQQPGVDGRPDRPPGRAGLGGVDRRGAGPAARPVVEGGDRLAEVGHVVDRDDDLDVELLAHAGVDDRDGAGPPPGAPVAGLVAAQEPGHDVERTLGGRQADALGRALVQRRQPLEREGEVGAPLGGHERVDLVDDHGLDVAQRLAGLGRDHQVQRLGRRDEDVGRPADQLAADLGRRVARAQADRGFTEGLAQPLGRGPDADERRPQVLLDIDRQRPQRRDVDDGRAPPLAPAGAAGGRVGRQPVDAPQEGRQRLARAGGGQDERVVALGDGRPPLCLGRRGGAEAGLEPRPDGGREQVQRHPGHGTEGL